MVAAMSLWSRLSALLPPALIFVTVSNYLRVRRSRSGRHPVPRRFTVPSVTTNHLRAVSREADRFDQMALRATRSIEASSAVTAAIAVLAIQLLHKDCPTDLTIGFSLASAALVVSIVSSLLVLRTPMQIEERKRTRSLAIEQAQSAPVPVPMAAFQQVGRVRDEAWIALVLRLAAIVVIGATLLTALGFMAAGQYAVSPSATSTIALVGRGG
jgi:hypothetical protein